MSKKDQTHQHRWQRRVNDWFILPHAPVEPFPRDVTLHELHQHTTKNDCWVVISNKVYDVTRFLAYHPGGVRVMEQYAGRDCTAAYERNHTALDPMDVVASCYVGNLIATGDAEAPPAPRPLGHHGSGKGTGFSGSFHRTHPKAVAGPSTQVVVDTVKRTKLFEGVDDRQLTEVARRASSSRDNTAPSDATSFGALFDTMDKNQNGYITKDDLRDLLLAVIGDGSETGEVTMEPILSSVKGDMIDRATFLDLMQRM